MNIVLTLACFLLSCLQEMKLPIELVHARLINNAEIDRHPEFRKLCASEKDFAQFIANRCAP